MLPRLFKVIPWKGQGKHAWVNPADVSRIVQHPTLKAARIFFKDGGGFDLTWEQADRLAERIETMWREAKGK